MLTAVSLLLLLPGLFLPVLTIRGVLTRDGIAQVAPVMLERGLNDETLAVLRSMMNPAVLGFLQATGGDLRQTIIDRLGPQLTASLQAGVAEVEVYEQTRSILGSVRYLYDVGSPIPASLILLFSVVVPLGKAALVAWATVMSSTAWRLRTLRFVETIGKWSMADVFAVALFIAYLAAHATQTTSAGTQSVVRFDATFGSGFYWFAAYCVFALASQQLITRAAAAAATEPVTEPTMAS